MSDTKHVMTTENFTTMLPQVIITPPPPSTPPPTPYLLSPPPPLHYPYNHHYNQHPAVQCSPPASPSHPQQTTDLHGDEDNCHQTHSTDRIPRTKQKKVRFKFSWDEPNGESMTSGQVTKARQKQSSGWVDVAKPQPSVSENKSDSSTVSTEPVSDITPQFDINTGSVSLHQENQHTVARSKRNCERLPVINKSEKLAESVSSVPDVKKTNVHSRDNSLSSESRTRICFEDILRADDFHRDVPQSSVLCEGKNSFKESQLIPSSKTADGCDNNFTNKHVSNTFPALNSRPHSSETFRSSRRHSHNSVNIHLYRIASRLKHHNHHHDKGLEKQAQCPSFLPKCVPQNHPSDNSNDDKETRTITINKTDENKSLHIYDTTPKILVSEDKESANTPTIKSTTYSENATGARRVPTTHKLLFAKAQPVVMCPRSVEVSDLSQVPVSDFCVRGVNMIGPRAGDVRLGHLPRYGENGVAVPGINVHGLPCRMVISRNIQRDMMTLLQKPRGCSAVIEEAFRDLGKKTPEATKPFHNAYGDNDCCRLMKVDFRRLTGQVPEVDSLLKSQSRKPAYEKLYRLTAVTSPDPATQTLRNELQASRLPFQARQRRPLTPEDIPESSVLRCRPVNSRPTTAHGPRPSLTPTAVGPQRPSSTPAHGMRTPHTSLHTLGFSPHPPSSPRTDTPRVEPGNFDTLSPRILSKLLRDVQPRPSSASYGDKVLLTRPEKKRGKKEGKESKINLNDDLSTTSGIDSDVDDDVSDDDDEDEDDDSSDSENGGFEPSLDDIRRQMPHPQSVFRLRPEKLDAIYVPEDKRDMRRFDFDAEKVEQPAYEFKCPLPDLLSKISLRLCAREGTDWQDYLTTTPTLGVGMKGMMKRLVELERYQIVTEEWEAKKLRGVMRRQEKLALSMSNPGSRATSAKTRDKRCCGLCLQSACVGDCPEKRLPHPGRCEKCHQPLCTGACQDSRYEQRMRRARSSDNLIFDEPPPPPPPRSPSRGCHSCLRRHNAKLINANNLLLGRPKSSNATYSRGKSSCRPRDLRPASAVNMSSTLIKDFERLGIEPQQPAPPSGPPSGKNRGRNSLLPGKSSRSNRKNSISESSRPKKKKTRNGRSSKGSQNAS